MFARSRDPRAVLTLLGALVPFASYSIAGCGSSGSSPTTTTGEGGAMYTTVVTAGGGIQAEASTDPFEGTSSSGSSSSSGGGSSGSVVDSGSSSGGDDASDGSPSSSGGPDAMAFNDSGVPYVSPVCGAQAGAVGCDLRTNICCLTQTLAGTCIPKGGGSCPSGQASVGCLQAAECPLGQSCCGVIEDIQGAVISSCKNVAQGGNCPYAPYAAISLYQGVQLCKTDAECKNVTDAGTPQSCIHQTCYMGAMLSMCGVQSTAPLSCAASP